jgi:DNA primase catalytic core
MARIPDSEVQRLKDEIAVQRLIESAGIELKKLGKDLAGRCPFHEDDTASLIVTPGKNLWHCFGCQIGGGPIDWVMKLKGVSFRHAVELLKDDCALAAVAGEPVKRSTVRALPPPVALDADDRALLAQVVDYYHQTLKQSPEALAYLQSRGLAHPEVIEHFKLGFANRTLGLRLPDKLRRAGADIRAKLERVGLYRASGHEHMAGSLVIPVLDEHGQVRDLYGRKITARLRPGTPLHLYLPANEERGRGVFNVAALRVAKEIILCESLIDALTFWCAGYRNVTTAYGVEGFTPEVLQAMKDHGTGRVLIAYDRDEAGDRAAGKLAPLLQDAGMDVWRIEFPKGMDANEYAQKVQPAAKSLGLLIRKALWMGQGRAPERQQEQATPLQPLAAEPVVATGAPAEPELLAARVPPAGHDVAAEVAHNEVTMTFGEGQEARRWRVRGLARNLAYEVLKVNVLVAAGDAFHVDTFDLYAARARAAYLAQAGAELGVSVDVLKADMGRALLKLEALQDESIQAALKPKALALPTMTDDEHMAALHLLNEADLPARILADFEAAGVVGEATNKLVGYLAAISRKLDRPLAIVIQSSSAAGKSSLMDAVLSFVPEEERVQYSAMTGQSLFYMGQTNLKHKILAIAEEEGAHRASYALKLLQSEGELTIASTGTDPATGNLVTQEYRVEGPMSLFMTTTAINIDEELMNRCLVLSVDEDREQTRAIHRLQRERRTLAGLTKKHEKQAILNLHRNAQRLLRPLAVVNPWADQLTFLDDRTRTRRDHDKYLTLIDAIALLHQHQRQIKNATIAGQVVEYIEASVGDIELANRIAHEVLGASLDELPPQTRRVLASVHALVQERMKEAGLPQREVRFTRTQVRAAAALSDTQARIHLERLAAMEFVLVHRGQRGQSYEYELLHDQQGEGPHLSGLIDTAALQSVSMNPGSRGLVGEFAGSTRPHHGSNAGDARTLDTAGNPHAARLEVELPADEPVTRATPIARARASYLQPLAA